MPGMSAVQFRNLRYFRWGFGCICISFWSLTVVCCFSLTVLSGLRIIFDFLYFLVLLFTFRNKIKKIFATLPYARHILPIVRVTSSKVANFTKISQNMPPFQTPPAKATRPRAKFYNIYVVANGPNHQVF